MMPDTMPVSRNSMRTRRGFVLSFTAKVTLIVVITLEALVTDAALVAKLWVARGSPGLPFYMLPIVHLLPWLAGMLGLWSIRRATRNGDLNATGVSTCSLVILLVLLSAYAALGSVESVLGSAWRF
jgi:hypothetical protein